jgi:hypothetical protein
VAAELIDQSSRVQSLIYTSRRACLRTCVRVRARACACVRVHSRACVRMPCTHSSNSGLDAEDWARLAPTLRACTRLAELSDFPWARALLLSPGAAHIGLSGAGLGDLEAAVLGTLLPRVAATLAILRLRCAVTVTRAIYPRLYRRMHEEVGAQYSSGQPRTVGGPAAGRPSLFIKSARSRGQYRTQ